MKSYYFQVPIFYDYLHIQGVLIWSDIFWEAVNGREKEISFSLRLILKWWDLGISENASQTSVRQMFSEIWTIVFSTYNSSLCYGHRLRIYRFFKNKFISLELFDFEKFALYFQKSPNLTILESTSYLVKFPFFYHLQPLRKCHFISRHPVFLCLCHHLLWFWKTFCLFENLR